MGDNPDIFGVAEDVMEIATGVASVVKSSYKAAQQKERLRQISKSKQVLQLTVENKTNYDWKMPKLYFARGEAKHGPEMTIGRRSTLEWTAASHPMVNGLDAVLTYDIIPSSSDTGNPKPSSDTGNPKLVILFSVSGGGSRKSGWKAEILNVSAEIAALKNPARRIYRKLQSTSRNEADCSAYEKLCADFRVLGIMAHSNTPDLKIEITEE